MMHTLNGDIAMIPVRVVVDHRTRGQALVSVRTDGESITEQRLHASDDLGLAGVALKRIELFIMDPLDAIAYAGAIDPERYGGDE